MAKIETLHASASEGTHTVDDMDVRCSVCLAHFPAQSWGTDCDYIDECNKKGNGYVCDRRLELLTKRTKSTTIKNFYAGANIKVEVDNDYDVAIKLKHEQHKDAVILHITAARNLLDFLLEVVPEIEAHNDKL